MKYIEKTIINKPYYVPLNCHMVESFSVDKRLKTVTVNLSSFPSLEVMLLDDASALNNSTIVLDFDIDNNKTSTLEALESWILTSIVSNGVPSQMENYYQGIYALVDRNTFAGGTIQHTEETE